MITAFYYVYSTIAQALAGAIGLLGAFVLFKLQGIDAELRDTSLMVIFELKEQTDPNVGTEPTELTQLRHLRGQGHFVEFIAKLDAYINKHKLRTFRVDREPEVARFRSTVPFRKHIVRTLSQSLLLTVVVMLASVLSMGALPLLTSCVIQWALAIAITAGFAGCLTLYVYLIRMVVTAG